MSTVAIPDRIVDAAGRGRDAVHDAIAEFDGTPIRNGNNVTLIYVGAADAVAVRHFLDIFPPIPDFERLGGSDVWATTFAMPPDARFEYKLAVRSNDRQRLVLDQLNPARAANPWGFNSEIVGAGYQPPSWARLRSDGEHGTVTRHDLFSKVYSIDRPMHIYRPAHGAPTALLVVHDGGDYLRFAGLARVLDNLIADGEIPPVAAVLSDPDNRLAEYRANAAHATYLVEEVVPMAVAETGAERLVAMGASLGGVASLHAAWTYPGTFAGLILQAGSFVTELGGPHQRGGVFGPVTKFMARFNAGSRLLPERVHVSCGRFDGLINEARVVADELTGRGVNVGYADAGAGHDWICWRDLLRSGLVHMFAAKERAE